MIRAADTTLAILAGGKARRLGGVAKGLLRLGGETFLEKLLKLRPCVAEVLLITNDEEPYQRFVVRKVSDVITDRGAPGGVHAALHHSATPWVAAIGCDMPFVEPNSLAVLLSQRSQGSDIVAFQNGQRIEPLFALYRTEIAGKWAKLIEESRSFAELFREFHTTVLPMDPLWAIDPSLRVFTNVNSPQELEDTGASLPAADRLNR